MTQTIVHDGFIRSIMASPEDEGVRLIFADFFEENGKDSVAGAMRQPGIWEIIYGFAPWLYWIPDGHKASESVSVGEVPAEVVVECEQCRIIPTPTVLGRVFFDDEWPKRRWLCRHCLQYERAVATAKSLNEHLPPCPRCCHPVLPRTHSKETCIACRNFRVFVRGGGAQSTYSE